MSGLLEALQRLEGRETPPSTPKAEPLVAPQVLAAPQPAVVERPRERDRFADFVAALTNHCPPPALIAFLTVGVEGSVTPLLRDHADAVVRNVGRDVVLLGPGLLDAATPSSSGWSSLRERAAYGFLHADADFAVARLNALMQVAAVVPVVELGRTSSRSVAQLRRVLAVHRIPVLGATVVTA
jgi:hypothetical protein